MNRVLYTDFFKSRAKRLHKKFASLKNDIAILEEKILSTPNIGESLGAGLYKIRLAVESKGSGKSSGFRIITYLIEENNGNTDIYFITIYDKSEESSIQKKTLMKLIKEIES